MPDFEADERVERDEAIIHYFERAMHILAAYQSRQRTAKQLRMSARAMYLALGFKLVAGAQSPAELARKCGFDKWTVTKCVNEFIDKLKLEPLPGQRDKEARKKMEEARKRQLEQCKTEKAAIDRVLNMKG